MKSAQLSGLSKSTAEFAECWARLMRWTELHFPELHISLNPPASDAEIDAAQIACKAVFPDDLRQLYQRANGEAHDHGLFFGLPFLTLERLVEEWTGWHDVAGNFPELNDNADSFFTSTPPGAIVEAYTCAGWIPIAHDHSGNHLGTDLQSGPAGRLGQIINFGSDEDDKFVIAPSLAAFLDWYAHQLEGGNFVLLPLADQPGAFEFTIAEPANEHFLDAIRELGKGEVEDTLLGVPVMRDA